MALLMATRRATFSSACLARVLSSRLHPQVSAATFSSRYLNNLADGATGLESDRKVFPTTVDGGDITRPNEFSMNHGICDTHMKNPLQTWGPKGAYEFKKVDEGLFLRMEMPGIDKDGLKISFDGDAIRVKGLCKKESHEEKGREYNVRIQIPSHEFKINQKVEGGMNNYVLALEIPKHKTIKVQAEMRNGVFESVEIEGNKELEEYKEAIHDNSGPNACAEENKAVIHDKSGPSGSPRIQKPHVETEEMLKDSSYKSKDFVGPTKDGVGKKEVPNNVNNLKDYVFQLEDVVDQYGNDSQASSSKNKESMHDDTCPNVQVDEKKEATNDKRGPSDSPRIENMHGEVREKMLNDFRSDLKPWHKLIQEFEDFVGLLQENEAKEEVKGFLCQLKGLVVKLEDDIWFWELRQKFFLFPFSISFYTERQTQVMLNEFRNELKLGHNLIHEFEDFVRSLKDNKGKKKAEGFLRELKDLVFKLEYVLDKYEKTCQASSSKKKKGLKRRWWPFFRGPFFRG